MKLQISGKHQHYVLSVRTHDELDKHIRFIINIAIKVLNETYDKLKENYIKSNKVDEIQEEIDGKEQQINGLKSLLLLEYYN